MSSNEKGKNADLTSNVAIVTTEPIINSQTVEDILEEGELIDSESSVSEKDLPIPNLTVGCDRETKRRKIIEEVSESYRKNYSIKRRRGKGTEKKKEKRRRRSDKRGNETPDEKKRSHKKSDPRYTRHRHSHKRQHKDKLSDHEERDRNRKRRKSHLEPYIVENTEVKSSCSINSSKSSISSVSKKPIVLLRDELHPTKLEEIPLPDPVMLTENQAPVGKKDLSAESELTSSENGFVSKNDQWLKALQSQAEMYARSRQITSMLPSHSQSLKIFPDYIEDQTLTPDEDIDLRKPSTWAKFLKSPCGPNSLPTTSQHEMAYPDHVKSLSSMQPFWWKEKHDLKVTIPGVLSCEQATSLLLNTNSHEGNNSSLSMLQKESTSLDQFNSRELEQSIKITIPGVFTSEQATSFLQNTKTSTESEPHLSLSPHAKGQSVRFKGQSLLITRQTQSNTTYPTSFLTGSQPSAGIHTSVEHTSNDDGFNSQAEQTGKTESLCTEVSESKRCWSKVHPEEITPGSLEFTVMSYNILAQYLMDQHTYLYSDSDHMDWEVRGPALTSQILAHHSDIVCLQEVQRDHWEKNLKRLFEDAGYGHCYKKRSGDKEDGCAILYKREKFHLLHSIPLEFSKGGILDRDNVAVILVLQPRAEVYRGPTERVCVATTHLLFNPRRGDVKLAQLMLLLAEIDKYAYKRQPKGESSESSLSSSTSRNRRGASSVDPPNDPEQNKFFEDCDDYASLEDGSYQSAKHQARTPHAYHPVILCGDFNSEPHSPLYNFLVKGYLDYKNHMSRVLSGQREGLRFGNNSLVPTSLLPSHLDVTELCQYKRLVKERERRLNKRSSVNINSGHAYHKLNFRSAYTPFVGRWGRSPQVVTTYHDRAACMVDYIFYSCACAPKSSSLKKKGRLSTSPQKSPSEDRVDTSEYSDTLGHDIIKSRQTLPNDSAEPLVLLSRYRLLTEDELSEYGPMPNRTFPSDHLCLLAKFMLR